jgi:probable rRNA maturation factor
LARFLRNAQLAVRLRGEVTVLLTSDTAIRRLNRQFRGKNKATDVLSFPADRSAPGSEKIAGDLAISVPTARRQGTACGHSLATELKVLILHGLLHLAGYDHETDSGQMARRERLLRARLRLPQGLIERVETSEPAGAKARGVLRQKTYGLKPVPSKLKPVPFPSSGQRRSALPHPNRKNPTRMWHTHPVVKKRDAGRQKP